ncbi:MAG: heme lyase CcmF/NrfE family subunit [Myxococcales bacterium]|nr:heme lyase CcmF/NrfE family subunit [Myxococcales bacterium]
MITEFGFYALRLALVVAGVGVAAGCYAGFRRREDYARVSERCVFALFVLSAFAMAVLLWAFIQSDFRFAYVAAQSARSMPLPYRMAALWGGQAGSLLLWLFVLSCYAALAVRFCVRGHRNLAPWISAVLLGNAAFFLVLLNFISNPFERVPVGALLSDGSGLNPLLQHPVMMIHPVMLYTGMVGFAVPFAFGIAALITGELGTAWLRTTRRWTLVAWAFLSVGILLGGRWAYEVLGWGGYWAWDPVENASFMPWLAGTAYLHSVMIQEKRDMLKIWNLALVGLTYSLCLFGTMLTRSGLVQSVHAFAQTKIFGILFLGYVLTSAGLFAWLLFRRRDVLRSEQRLESVVSRESGFLLNNWAFMGILAVVFWGTLFPKISDWLTAKEILLGPAFFNRLVTPLALLLLFLTGVGPLIAWRKASFANLRRQFVWPASAGIITAFALFAVFGTDIGFYPHVTWSLCAFVTTTIVQEYTRAIAVRRRAGDGIITAFATLLRKNQRRYGGYIVHLGMVFIFLGIAGAGFNEERLENLQPGSAVSIGDYKLQYLTARALPEQHYGGAVARLALWEGDEPRAVMAPEKRMYWLEQQPASIPSVYSTMREDLYVILTGVEHDGSATLKIYRNPLVNWIWLGGLTFVLGTIAILWPHAGREGRPSAP